MSRQDTTDFLTAFAVGAVLGAGATLLFRTQPVSAKDRLLRELKPYRRKLGKSAGHVARGLRKGGRATGALADDAIDAGRELLSEFRDEVRRIVADAVEEVNEAVEERGRKRAKRPRREATEE